MSERPELDSRRQTIARTSDPAFGYSTLAAAGGENAHDRTDLGVVERRRPRQLASLVQMTDFQLADLLSPSRTEFLQRFEGNAWWQRMLPAYRPAEMLELHALTGAVSAIRRFSEVTPVDAVITTGDNVDSGQLNEVRAYQRVLDGGVVDPAGLGVNHPATASAGHDPAYWHGRPDEVDDWQRRGFPTHPGLLDAAAVPFTSAGLGVDWLCVYGNHDCLAQGRIEAPADFDEFVTGTSKAIAPPPDAAVQAASATLGDAPQGGSAPGRRADAMDAYMVDPAFVYTGASAPIAADADRRLLDRRGYVQAHLDAEGRPHGHGFSEQNAADGTAYYVWDAVASLRVICLDTTNPAGDVNGCLDHEQFVWLEQKLREVAPGSSDARLVVLASHHGLSTLTNARRNEQHPEPVHLAGDVEQLLHQHPHVIAWLSGHIHVNRIIARAGGASGFWEITTGAVCEWPAQTRHLAIELDDTGAVITTTMLNSDADLAPGFTPAGLAGIHREVAANDADSVGGLQAQGTADDRNVRLHVPLPREVVASLGKGYLTD